MLLHSTSADSDIVSKLGPVASIRKRVCSSASSAAGYKVRGSFQGIWNPSLEHLLANLNVVGYTTAALARVVSSEVHKTHDCRVGSLAGSRDVNV